MEKLLSSVTYYVLESQFEILSFVTIWVFSLSQFKFLSDVTIWGMNFFIIWDSEFCQSLSLSFGIFVIL